jgi:hypothetical protein
MYRISHFYDQAEALSLEDFVRKYPTAVLVARKMMGGLIKKKDKAEVSSVIPEGIGTMLHIDAIQLEEEMDPTDVELAETRILAKEFVFLIKKKSNAETGPITIGRTTESDITINDYTISKRHAMILWDPRVRRFVLADSGSTNGTAIGTRTLKTGEKCVIENGYWITLGRLVCQFMTAQHFYTYLGSK